MNISLKPTIANLAQKDLTDAIQLGVIHHQAGNIEQAESIYQQIIQVHPNNANALHLLGLIAHQRGEHHCAVDYIKQAININGSISGFHYNLGNVFKAQNELQEAADCYHAALRIDSNHLDALNNLGNVFREQGKIKEAIELFHKLLDMKPDEADYHSNLLLTLNYHASLEPELVSKEHIEWFKRHAEPFKESIKAFPNDTSPHRRLRIGYVSPDFRRHSVAYFIESVLEAHDRSMFKIICYSNVPRADAVTNRLKLLSDKWCDIWQMTDNRVVDRVRNDKIDILIDLAGHMSNNRLTLFAHKPAPVQVTYLGYPNTTGLSTIDYRLTDVWADPYGVSDHLYSEELVRLPKGFLCFRPPENGSVIADLPALRKGTITFGSFNNIAKVSPETAQLWSAILKSVPHSKLILKSRALTDMTTCQHIKQMFIQNGISADRVETISFRPNHGDHLALYNEIDIALDPFPYNGTTTTCESIWMGAPVVTLAGKTHASRVGVSLLSSIGMTNLIAETPEQYKHITVKLSNDLNQLQTLRVELRRRMLQSSLTDAETLTRALEKSYRKMWQHWCNHSDKTGLTTRPKYSLTPKNSTQTCESPSNKENKLQPSYDSQSEDTTNVGVGQLIDQVYEKRLNGEGLSEGDLMLMLAHTIMDQRFFQSKYWKFRYGGIRYYPGDVKQSNPGRVLVLQWPGALGDAAMAAHFYAALRHKYPQARIAMFGNCMMRSIYEHSGLIDIFLDNPLDTYLDQVLSGQPIPISDLMEQITVLAKQFASEAFDLLINLQILPMTAVIAKLSYAGETLGMTLSDDGMPVIRGNQWYPYLFGTSANLMRTYNSIHRRTIFNRLAGLYPDIHLEPAAFIGQKSIQAVQQFLDENGIKDQDVLIGISPMASSPLKAWKQYEELIKALWKRYGAKMILFGSYDEGEAISRIIKKSGGHAIQATHLSINELMAAISGCDLFITNDTGPMHLACLLKRKVVALFGPTTIRDVGPWNTDYIALQSDQCNGCHKATCDFEPSCMDHISIKDVLSATEYFLNNETSAKENISSGVRWYSAGDSIEYSDKVDEIVSIKYSNFFSGPTGGDSDMKQNQTALDTVRDFCRDFESRVKNALGNLEVNRDVADAIEIDRAISENCGFLKGIMVLNDMKFLDKRRPLGDQIESYKMYYNGILKDIKQFLET